MTANPYEEGSLQHEMWNNLHNKKVEKERIDYVETLKELIRIEKKSKQKAIFSEKYLRQLERRIKIFQAGKSDVIKQVIEIVEYLNEKFRKENTYVRCEGDEFNDIWEEELKSRLGELTK